MGEIDVLRERQVLWRTLYEGAAWGGKLGILASAGEMSLTLIPVEKLAPVAAATAFVTLIFGVGCAACAEVFGSRSETCQNEILFLQGDTNS